MDWTQKRLLDLLTDPNGIRDNPGTFKNQHIAVKIFAILTAYPGLTNAEIGKKIGETRRRVYNSLPYMERLGLLLFEDDDGRLFAHSNQSDPDRIRKLKCRQ